MTGTNKCGVPDAEWQRMSPTERRRCYRRQWFEHVCADPIRYAKHRAGINEYKRRRRREGKYWRKKGDIIEQYRLDAADIAALTDKQRHSFYRTFADLFLKRSHPQEVRELIGKSISLGLPSSVRDDVIAAMSLAVLEGKLVVAEIEKEARKYVTAYNREFETFKTLSLDAPVPGFEGLTYLDRLGAEPIDEEPD